MNHLVSDISSEFNDGTKNYTNVIWQRDNEVIHACREKILSNFPEIVKHFGAGRFTRVRDFGRRRITRKTKHTDGDCHVCGCSVFKIINGNKYCTSCLSLQQMYSSEDDIGINDHNSMTAVGGSKKQAHNYDKPGQFSDFVNGIMGTGRQFYMPDRYIHLLREMSAKSPKLIANNPRQFLTDCLYKLGIDYEYQKSIPNVYFAVTGTPFLEIKDVDMPWILHVYQKINDIKIRKYPNDAIPNGKYMLRRILTLLNIPFELHKIGTIKETDRLWRMDKKWNKYLEDIDVGSILRERAKQLADADV